MITKTIKELGEAGLKDLALRTNEFYIPIRMDNTNLPKLVYKLPKTDENRAYTPIKDLIISKQ